MIEERYARSETPDSRYELADDELSRLTIELLHEREPVSDDRFICYRLDGNDRFSDLGRTVEGAVFNDTFHNSPEEMEREYGPYEDQSVFFLSVDRETQRPTGVLRVIRNGENGLKTINDLSTSRASITSEYIQEKHNITDMNECQDIGTVAVLPENRSAQGGISVQLYRAMYVDAMEAGIKHVVSIVDQKPLQKLTGYLGIPFVPLADMESFSYLGSEKSQPVYGYVPDFYKKMNRKRFTPKGILARNVLSRLVKGSRDSELQFDSRYKK